ncbi:hypothetical protein GLAREA_04733 [Glarea lozoyensis ATCC 20868]|uniref:Uncharacterized protein n=1 Tax=Glarea lozoyensis (strain ATCC 20868 / MF5171) TaxID=1116229 RepID=S3CN89_GLAL2|nr:uncharacterized protein GLAREA_04733 [Glarea lozoyensis ATCC 20868]EPE27942.1 hypothetical protein GLAREA_04733 [Glarea lozoyensis ATCC 20868]
MDDPWGSPWADDANLTQPNKAFVKGNDEPDRTAPPTLKFKVSGSNLAQQSNNPFWKDAGAEQDDDGFGNWADVPANTGVGLDSAIDGWGGNTGSMGNSRLDKLTPRSDDGSAVSWGDTSLAQENFVARPAPSLSINAANVVRQPSPDPWAFNELSSTQSDSHDDGDQELQQDDIKNSAMAIDLDVNDSKLVDRELQTLTDNQAEIFSDVNETVEPAVVLEDKQNSTSSAETPEIPEEEDKPLSDATIEPIRSSITQDVAPSSSRPSSAPSDESRQDGRFAESPRTSLDDEPKRLQMPRQASKVHQLVEHFDTLAKREGTPELQDGRVSAGGESTTSANDKQEDLDDNETYEQKVESDRATQDEDGNENEEDDDFGDFGDFEEGDFDGDQPEAAQIFQQSESDLVSDEAANINQTDSPATSPEPVEFSPNVVLLNDMYPDLVANLVPEKIFIPDVVPHDSFSSVEERKMWYRLSRYGPMRKHESGDDENYVRINWAKSSVREETLKVVARWIEEDRISGRVVLGGGSKAGSIFGWNDPKSKPASIAAAFAERNPRKKKSSIVSLPPTEIPREWPTGLVRDRSTSKGRSASKPRRRSSVKPAKVVDDIDSGRVPALTTPVVDFGWSSNATLGNDQRTANQPHSSHNASESTSSFTYMSGNSSPTPLQAPTTKRASFKSLSHSITPTSYNAVAESRQQNSILPVSTTSSIQPSKPAGVALAADDDWGEMVASPVVASAPTLPIQESVHKTFQAADNILSVDKAAASASMKADQSHPPRSSMDQILIPTPVSTQTTSGDPPLAFAFDSSMSSTKQEASPLPFPDSKTAAAISQAGSSDPWASADFSFFDTAPSISAPALAPKPQKKPVAVSVPPRSGPTSIMPAPAISKTRRSKEEMEQDKIVESIISGLPDLSYMLKR